VAPYLLLTNEGASKTTDMWLIVLTIYRVYRVMW
jgi:hypothetical protein